MRPTLEVQLIAQLKARITAIEVLRKQCEAKLKTMPAHGFASFSEHQALLHFDARLAELKELIIVTQTLVKALQ